MKTIVFLTGTRADYGKLKPLIRKVNQVNCFTAYIYATGMHALYEYGYTATELFKDNMPNIFVAINQSIGESMDFTLANTIKNFGQYVAGLHPDFIVIHGDRVEALAGAIVGALRNIPVIHVEGGEVSGTVDEILRHAISKLAHVHMVSNEEAKKRIIQLGEDESRVFVIGSPEIDIMLSDALPTIEQVKSYYDIFFDNYAVLLYHPVTTLSMREIGIRAQQVVEAIMESDKNYIVIYPNNDWGCRMILSAYKKLKQHPRVKLYSSMRFEYFLSLFKYCDFIIGNSSAGIRQAPIYAKYAINLGERQHRRYLKSQDFVISCQEKTKDILSVINKISLLPAKQAVLYWGDGNSAERFINILKSGKLDNIILQKQFVDLVEEYVV